MALPEILLPYQKKFIADTSGLRIWNKSRQIGASFTFALDGSLDAIKRKRLKIYLSRGQRQSNELGRKAKEHMDALALIERSAAGAALTTELPGGLFEGVEITQTNIDIPATGSRMIFLPANPDTARGYSGDVYLDEFAFHKNAKAIYAAVYPSITRGYGISVGSTPFGESGMFYELCEKESGYSKHHTDIYEAVADGLARSVGIEDQAFIKMLRDGCPDDDIWEQEYCCKFISDATSYIPWEMITGAESLDASVELPLDSAPHGQLYLGGDIGRRKDLTVLVLLEKLGDVYWIRAIIRMRNKTFAEQRAVIDGLFTTLPIQRYCQDATGLGMQLAEELTHSYGTTRVEGVTFNMAVKEDMAVRTRRNFENSTIRIPEDRALRSAIHNIRRIPTAAGHFRFDAERSEAGHSDEFWALALALLAADGRKVTLGFAQGSRIGARNAMRGF
jgi:phage FluMu gp28-like protein